MQYQQQQQQQQQHYQQHMHQQPGPDEQSKDKVTIASLQNQLVSMSKEVSQAAEQLMHVNVENGQLKKTNIDLQQKLDTTREALRETRDSLEQVQTVIKPLTLAQRAKEQQLQQLGAMNRLYEAKISDYETKIRQAEATIQRHIQQSAAAAGDEALIEKLHERLVTSQNSLVKCQSDMQRMQVATASSNAELVEARRNVSALEVQLLVQKQAHHQALQAQRDQAMARENCLTVELSASKRRLAGLEEQLQMQLSLREATRKEEQLQSQAALSEEIRAAMNRISGYEEQRNAAGGMAQHYDHFQSAKQPSPQSSFSSPTGGGGPPSPGSFKSLLKAASFRGNPAQESTSLSSSAAAGSVSGKKGFFSGSFLGTSKKLSSSPPQQSADLGGAGAAAVLAATASASTKALTIDVGGGAQIRANQIIDVDAAQGGGGYEDDDDDGMGSPSSTASDINMPILFRPLADITDEVKRLEADKERTVKSIKEWSEAFSRSNKREPTSADVSRSPEIKALYDEMDEVRGFLRVT